IQAEDFFAIGFVLMTGRLPVTAQAVLIAVEEFGMALLAEQAGVNGHGFVPLAVAFVDLGLVVQFFGSWTGGGRRRRSKRQSSDQRNTPPQAGRRTHARLPGVCRNGESSVSV